MEALGAGESRPTKRDTPRVRASVAATGARAPGEGRVNRSDVRDEEGRQRQLEMIRSRMGRLPLTKVVRLLEEFKKFSLELR